MASLNNSKLAFIGAGKMAEALISGLCLHKTILPFHICIFDKDKKRMKHVKSCFGVRLVMDSSSAVAGANIIILAVKPADMADLLLEIAPFVTKFQLVISIAAGITLEALQKKLKKIPLVRAMPNNPAMVGAGITALSEGRFAKEAHLKYADTIFKTVGETVFVPEKYMNAVTALSGSGPAFVYMFLEGLLKGSERTGLPLPVAKRLALATIKGAVAAVEKTGYPLKELIKMVASKGGTTEAGLKVLKKYKLINALEETIMAANKRSSELSR